MMDMDPQDIPFFILFSFAFLHLLYFAIYYGRYSTLNQKLAKIARLEKAGLVDQSSIDLTRNNTHYRIQRMRRICYLPNAIILLVHWTCAIFYFGKQLEITHFLEPVYIALAGTALILLGNFTKGAQIIDPNRRFFSRGRF